MKKYDNKFNKTINPSGNTPPLGWWKFKKNRYITINHPAITTKEKCAFKVETILSPQENQILEGLTRTLQTSKRDAVRIAIYELGKDVFKAENFLKYADKKTKEKGHTSRSFELPIRVIKAEKEIAQNISKQFEISEKEAIRLCIIWLGNKTHELSFKMTNCKRLGQEKLAREWSKKYDGSGSKLNKLNEASHAAYERAEKQAQLEKQEREDAAKRMQWMAGAGDYQLTGEFESDLNRFILLENMEEEERMEKEFEQILEDENIKSKREQDIRRAMFYFPFMDREDAEDYVKEQAEELVKEAEEEQWLENASDEELIDKDWWQFFFYRCNYNCEPIWANDKNWEKQSKRKENETATEYEARAFPPEYVKESEDQKKKEREKRMKNLEVAKKEKKLRQRRDLVNDLTSEVERWGKKIEELNAKNLKDKTEKELEEHQKSLRWAQDALAIQKKRLTDANYLDLYWDELSQ